MEAWPRAGSDQETRLMEGNKNNNKPQERMPGSGARQRNSAFLATNNHDQLSSNIGTPLQRSRHGSNVTIMGVPSFKNSDANSTMHNKKPSTTTTIADDDFNRKRSLSEKIENLVGIFALHVMTVALALILLIAAISFNVMLFFKIGMFRDRDEKQSYGNILKLVPNEFNFLSFMLLTFSFILQVIWQCYLCFKIKLAYEYLCDDQLQIMPSWTAHLTYDLALALEIGFIFLVYGEIHWGCSAFSAAVFVLLFHCLKQEFNSLVNNQHIALLWSRPLVSFLERYLAQNALSSLVTLRLTGTVFYLGTTLTSSAGLSMFFSDLIIFILSISLICIHFVTEAFVMGDVSTLYFSPCVYSALVFLNTMFSNVKHGKIIEMYFCAFLVGLSCFVLCIKVVVTLELRNQSPERENFKYMMSEYQFALNTREGRSARSRSARTSTRNRFSAAPRSRKGGVSNQITRAKTGVITVTHERSGHSPAQPVQVIEHREIPVTPPPPTTQSVTDMVGEIEEFMRRRTQANDSNNFQDSGVSFME